ncbi:tyrosine-type recombinase/integrase [Brevibacillus centrosporus]|uniref:tyrosine-type recombinase/integrase n=1 Tax=Brevibacillus centrosporus TaxID=54910 RepID=UPI00398732B7
METVQPFRDRQQIKTMKILLGHQKKRDKLLFVLGLNSGLRISDILLMNIRDVIDKRGRPVKQYELIEQKTQKRTKRKKKLIEFSEDIRNAISEYLAELDVVELDRPLFSSQKRDKDGNYKPISRQHAWAILNRVARQIGIEDRIGCHSMRKSFGYHAYLAGVPLEYLMQIFNHSDKRITLDYIGITQDALNEVYRTVRL